jgi:hypothetical protein
MRYFKIVSIALSIVTVSALAGLAFEDLSAQRGFGVGMQVTFPMRPPQALPASGMSVRVWLWDRFGIEGDFFVVGSSLSFTPRLFLKVINLEIADLYVGGGVSFFTYAPPQEALMLYIPVQGVVGLEMQIALNGEIGVFGLGGTRGGVTSGLGVHLYF